MPFLALRAPARRRRPVRSAVIIALVTFGMVLLALSASPACAYVRKRTSDTFIPMFWPDPRLTLEVARPSEEVGVSTDALVGAAQFAAAAWSYPAIPCTGVSVAIAAAVTDSQLAGRDGRSRIVMRVGDWCRDPMTQSYCHDPSAVALTTFFSRANPGQANDGQILEADIEINAVGTYQWAVIPDGPISGRDFANFYDLASVLTHETGHFIGLDHTCSAPGNPLLIDDRGLAYPDCAAVPVDDQSMILSATMYPFMNLTDVHLRTLTSDDARAACEIYPPSSIPWEEWSGAGGCAAVPSPPSSSRRWALGTVVLLSAIVLGDRRARRRRAAPLPPRRNSAS